MDEEKSNLSGFGAPLMAGGHQATADDQNYNRIQKLLTRNSNLIKEP